MKPTCIQRATRSARPRTTASKNAGQTVRVVGLGVVPVDRVIRKAAQVLRIAARREILKRAHPQMARCHARQHAARQHALTHDAFPAKDCR